jgi:hypothetical protein
MRRRGLLAHARLHRVSAGWRILTLTGFPARPLHSVALSEELTLEQKV